MQITATGSDYRCVWPGGTGKRCYCGDCFWGMCICQSLPNCIIHSIVCVIQHFLRNAQISRLSTCPHLLTAVSHPTCLLSKPGQQWADGCPSVRHARVGEGPEVCSQRSSEKPDAVNMRGQTRLWTCWSWRRQWSSQGMRLCYQPTLRFENHWSSWIGGKQPKALGSGGMRSQEFGVQSSTTPQGILEYVKNVLVVENLTI